MFSALASLLAWLLAALLSLIGIPAPPTHPTPPSQASVVVQPETVALHPGQTQQLTVVVTDSRGRPADPATVRWSTSAASVAVVSSAGLVRAVAPGMATITATSQGATDTSVVTVTTVAPPNQPPSVTITAPAAGAQVSAGSAVTFTASASDAEDGDLGANVSWTLTAQGGDPVSLGSGPSVTSAELAAGSYTAVATVTDSGGLSATAQLTITVTPPPPPPNQPPSVTITAPAAGAQVSAGSAVTFTASASDAEDGDLGANVSWTLTAQGGDPVSLGSGPSVTSAELAAGSYTAVATVTDSGGLSATAQLTITVIPANCVVTAELDPPSAQRLPQLLALSAAASTDSCGRPLRYFWGCQSDTSTVCPDFVVTANADGNTHPITAVDLKTFDEIAILLTVCAVDPASSDPRGDCAPLITNVYRGAVTSV